MIKEITKHIADNTSFTLDTDLFCGFRPPNSPDTCLVVLQNAPGEVSFYLPDKVAKRIQVISRAPDYHTAEANIMPVFSLLHGKTGITLPVVDEGDSYYADTIEAIASPQSIGQDEKGLWEFSCNFIFRIHKIIT